MSQTVKKSYSASPQNRIKSMQYSKSKKRKTILWVFLLIFAAATVVSSLLYGFVLGGHVVVMRINEIPVTREEFIFYMNKERTAVTSYFYQTYGVKASEQVGTKKYGSERPIDVLKENVNYQIKSGEIA